MAGGNHGDCAAPDVSCLTDSGRQDLLSSRLFGNRQHEPDLLADITAEVVLLQGGIAKRLHDSLQREFLHTYGHQHILTFHNLHLAGMSCPVALDFLQCAIVGQLKYFLL